MPALIEPPPFGVPLRYMRIRKQCRKLLRDIGFVAGTDLRYLLDALEPLIGPVQIVQEKFPVPGFFSGTMEDPVLGYVLFVQEETAAAHQAHFALHELGHVLLGTCGSGASITRGTHRHGDYTVPEERDAEFVAQLVGTWVDLSTSSQLIAQPTEHLASLAGVLEDRLAW